MKGLLVTGPHQAAVVDVPRRPLGAGNLRVRVSRAGICGTDLSLYAGKLVFARYPITPGHEFSGTVVEAGPGTQFRVGDRVTANPILSCRRCPACLRGEINHCAGTEVLGVVSRSGAFAEEVVVDDDMLDRLPDSVSFDAGAMVEPLAVAVRIADRAGDVRGKSVALLGGGGIGLLALQVLRTRGARFVMITDLAERRLSAARELGADLAVNAAKVDVVAAGRQEVGEFDVVVDGVGIGETILQSIQLCRAGGTLVIYGVPSAGESMQSVIQASFRKDLNVATSRLYPRSLDGAIDLLAKGLVRIEPLITHRVSLEEVPDALERLLVDKEGAIKVLAAPWSD